MTSVAEKCLSHGFVCRKFSDDESDSEQEDDTKPAGYYEEQEAIRRR